MRCVCEPDQTPFPPPQGAPQRKTKKAVWPYKTSMYVRMYLMYALDCFFLQIAFNTSSHFYSGITDDEILEYQTITNLRLNLRRAHTDISSEEESYYAISEWFVYGTCLCNGHADQCAPLPEETGPSDKVCYINLYICFSYKLPLRCLPVVTVNIALLATIVKCVNRFIIMLSTCEALSTMLVFVKVCN